MRFILNVEIVLTAYFSFSAFLKAGKYFSQEVSFGPFHGIYANFADSL